MRTIFDNFIHTGIDSNTSSDQRIKIKGINAISLVLIPALAFLIILESFNPLVNHSFILMLSAYLGLVCFVLYLNIFRHFQLAYNLILFVAPLGIFAEIILFGNSFRADTLFMIVFVAGIFLQPSFRPLLLTYLLYAGLLATSQIYLYHNPPIIETQPYAITEYMAMILALLSVALIVKNYESEKVREERKMQALLAQLAEKNKELVRVNRDLEDFTFATSHDLKTPIRLLVSFSDLLRRKKDLQTDQETQDYLHFINENSRHMYQLIENLLSYARVKDQPVRKEWVDLQVLIEELTEILQEAVPALQVQIPQQLPRVLSHRDSLRLLFHNLLENGIKYNTNEEVIIRVQYTYEKGKIRFQIYDNGIGIDHAYNDYIFKIFKRLHNSSAFPGTGIGLSTCKRILEGWGGKIWFESQLEIGTTFLIEWPVSKTAILVPTIHAPTEMAK